MGWFLRGGVRPVTLTIVSWHSAEEVDEHPLDDPQIRGWLGGYAPGGRIAASGPWDAYVDRITDDAGDRERLEALKAYIVENELRRGGWWHQREGIPKFSDGSMLYLSMRAWGDLMAAIWGGDYCLYAWED